MAKATRTGYFIAGDRVELPDWVRIAMEKALRQWLESHGLPAIVAAVLGLILALAALLVVGGYWWVTP